MKTRGETVHYLYILIYVGKYSYYCNPAVELLHLLMAITLVPKAYIAL
jgi:hypothetical protein